MIASLRRLWPSPGALGTLALLHLIGAVLHGLLLGSLVPIFRSLLRSDPDFAAATPWLVAAGFAAVGYVLVSLASSPVTFAATTELSAALRHRLMDHATTLPVGWFSTDNKGRLSRTVTSAASAVTHLAVLFGPKTIDGVVVPSVISIIALAVDWRVGLILLVLVPIALLTRQRSAKITSEADIALERVGTEVASRAIELAQAQPVLRATGHGTSGSAPMARAIAEHERTYRAGMRRVQLPSLLFRAAIAAGCLAILVVVTGRMLDGHLLVADAIALLVLTVRMVETLSDIGAFGPVVNAADRVLNVLDTKPLPLTTAPVTEITEPTIELDDVTFDYGNATAEDATAALNRITLTFPTGSTTALVGPSGSGKSTLLHVIARFHDTGAGTVRIGGTDVRELAPDALMRDLAVIFQDVYLFDDTIEANVRLGRPDASAADLRHAAEEAGLDEVIERLPNGWQTQVGEGGAQLSGGERQRVSIARAFLKDARIVLIDEAASALDAENEAAISDAIATLGDRADRTVIVIAHRPATLTTADRVVVLDHGRVVETGHPQDLMTGDGAFARMYAQFDRARAWRINHTAR